MRADWLDARWSGGPNSTPDPTLMPGAQQWMYWCLMHSIEPYWRLMHMQSSVCTAGIEPWCIVRWCTVLSHFDAWCTALSHINACCTAILMPDGQYWATYWCLIALSHGCMHSFEPYNHWWWMMQRYFAQIPTLILFCFKSTKKRCGGLGCSYRKVRNFL